MDAHKSDHASPSATIIALVGNPNTGKSSLFNALCGMNARVGNFPGVTVEKKLGRYVDDTGQVTLSTYWHLQPIRSIGRRDGFGRYPSG